VERIHNRGDIDIDFANRDRALAGMNYVPASIIKDGKITKHNTGVYFHDVPQDPVTGLCSIDYEAAESKGFFKLDFLNVGVYEQVRDEAHLLDLMHRPIDWEVFGIPAFVSQLFHLGNYGDLTARLKPQSIEHIAMILALIRPGKRHLQKQCERRGFDSIRDDIWTKGDAGYEFKKAHAVSYAMLVYVHANLLLDQLTESVTVEESKSGDTHGSY
jgi:DNA polymerase III alpha subunit